MKKITFPEERKSTIHFSEVSQNTPIFAKRDGKLSGMVVKEGSAGWILRIGGDSGANGHHSSARQCMESCLKYKHEFFVE